MQLGRVFVVDWGSAPFRVGFSGPLRYPFKRLDPAHAAALGTGREALEERAFAGGVVASGPVPPRPRPPVLPPSGDRVGRGPNSLPNDAVWRRAEVAGLVHGEGPGFRGTRSHCVQETAAAGGRAPQRRGHWPRRLHALRQGVGVDSMTETEIVWRHADRFPRREWLLRRLAHPSQPVLRVLAPTLARLDGALRIGLQVRLQPQCPPTGGCACHTAAARADSHGHSSHRRAIALPWPRRRGPFLRLRGGVRRQPRHRAAVTPVRLRNCPSGAAR